jgi:hypothetical protein
MLKRVLFTLVIIFTISTCCYSYTFENYEWGKSVSEIEKLVATKHKNYKLDNNPVGILYEDTIFEEKCIVGLLFSPNSKLLSGIYIEWENKNIGRMLKEVLTDKYGMPSKDNQFMDKYNWGPHASSKDYIALDYSFNKTKCAYYSGKFWLQYQNESKMKAAKEAPKF